MTCVWMQECQHAVELSTFFSRRPSIGEEYLKLMLLRAESWRYPGKKVNYCYPGFILIPNPLFVATSITKPQDFLGNCQTEVTEAISISYWTTSLLLTHSKLLMFCCLEYFLPALQTLVYFLTVKMMKDTYHSLCGRKKIRIKGRERILNKREMTLW